MSPYRHHAPRLPDPRPKRSTLRRLARVGDRSCRLYLPFRFRWRRVPRKTGAMALCLALYFLPVTLFQAWPAWIRWPLLFAFGLAAWSVVDVAMGYLRLRRVRRAIRARHDCAATSRFHWERRTCEDGSFTFVRAECLDCGRRQADAEEHSDAARYS